MLPSLTDGLAGTALLLLVLSCSIRFPGLEKVRAMEAFLTLLARLRMAVGAVSGPQISGLIAILLILVAAHPLLDWAQNTGGEIAKNG